VCRGFDSLPSHFSQVRQHSPGIANYCKSRASYSQAQFRRSSPKPIYTRSSYVWVHWRYQKTLGVSLMLTNTPCLPARPTDRLYSLFDGHGTELYPAVPPADSKVWRMKFSYQPPHTLPHLTLPHLTRGNPLQCSGRFQFQSEDSPVAPCEAGSETGGLKDFRP
jgi:hypothetical protein